MTNQTRKILREYVEMCYSALPNKIRQHVEEHYGLRNTIDTVKIGYSDDSSNNMMTMMYPDTDLIATGTFIRSKTGGIMPIFNNRIIFPYWKNGEVVYLIGRKTDDTPKTKWESAKYKKLPTNRKKHPGLDPTISNEYFYNEDCLQGRPKSILITEGVTDCLAAMECGIPCISPVTTKFRLADFPKLIELTKDCDELVICNDVEDNKSGLDGALTVAAKLVEAGKLVRIAELPENGSGKIDLNEFLRDQGADALAGVISTAKRAEEFDLPSVEVTQLDHSDAEIITPDELESLLAQIPVEEYADNDSWFAIMAAAAHATDGDGLDVFLEWSLSDDRYAGDADEITDRWHSVKSSGTTGRNLGTLIREAQNRGGHGLGTDPRTLLDADPLPAAENPRYREERGVQVLAQEITTLRQTAIKTNALRRYDSTDSGNADRYVYINSDRARYNRAVGWLCWDGSRWAADDGECLATGFARDTRRVIHREAEIAYSQDKEEVGKELFKHGIKTGGSQGLKSMLGLAARDIELWRNTDKFDIDPNILNVQNGTVDLRTGKLRPHERDDYITRIARVSYVPEVGIAESRWEQFLREIFPDEEIRHFMQTAIGYSATGLTSEKNFFVCYGESGNNGKSVFMETVGRVLGVDYFRKAPQGTFVKSPNKNPANIAANIFGARIIYDSELNERDKLDESTIKSLTGDAMVSACFKYREPFEYEPTYSLWLSTNHRPRIQGTDTAIWSRVDLVPFTVQIPKEQQDKQLGAKLAAESQAILTWIVEGAVRWYREGLTRPEAVKGAVERYRSDSDIVQQWMADCTVLDHLAETETKILYDSFKKWAIENGEKPMTSRGFGRRLTSIDGLSKRKSHGLGVWCGVKLIDEDGAPAVLKLIEDTPF